LIHKEYVHCSAAAAYFGWESTKFAARELNGTAVAYLSHAQSSGRVIKWEVLVGERK
jgi:hypothetical protein